MTADFGRNPDWSSYPPNGNRPRDVGASGATAPDWNGVECRPSLPTAGASPPPDHLDVALTLAAAARALRDAVKDKSYQRTPLGEWVRRYVRYLEVEYDATKTTVRDYEAILARMCLTLADKQVIEVDTEDLRDVIALWSTRTPRTRQKVTSVIRSFWKWMEEQGHIALSPASRIRRPKGERKVARVLPGDARPRLLEAAKHPRDRLGLFCLLALGMRREELGGLRVGDFDVYRGWVTVYGKGRKERRLPVRGMVLTELKLFLAVELPYVGRLPEEDDYLLYPVRRLADGKGIEGQMVYRRVGEPKKRPSPQATHRWWYRIAQDAGLVGKGMTSGLNMHRARHLFAMEMRRAAGIDAASQALGHSDLSTTLGIYGHRGDSDLEQAMDRYLRWLDDNDDAV